MPAIWTGAAKTGAAAVPVLVIVNSWPSCVPHDDVEIAVAVEIAERRGGGDAHVDAGDLDRRAEDGRRRRAGVGDHEQVAVDVPYDDVEVAVAVEVAEGRCWTKAPTSMPAICTGAAKTGAAAVPVLVIVNRWPSDFASDDVEVAVAVEIAEGWLGVSRRHRCWRSGPARRRPAPPPCRCW